MYSTDHVKGKCSRVIRAARTPNSWGMYIVLARERTATREGGGATCEGGTNTRERQYECECGYEYEYKYDPTSMNTRHMSERKWIKMGRMEHCTRVCVIVLWSRGTALATFNEGLRRRRKGQQEVSLSANSM